MTEILKKPDDNDKNATNPWEGLGDDLIIVGFGEDGPVLGAAEKVENLVGTKVPLESRVAPGRDREKVPLGPEDIGPRAIRGSGLYDITPQGRAVPRADIR